MQFNPSAVHNMQLGIETLQFMQVSGLLIISHVVIGHASMQIPFHKKKPVSQSIQVPSSKQLMHSSTKVVQSSQAAPEFH